MHDSKLVKNEKNDFTFSENDFTLFTICCKSRGSKCAIFAWRAMINFFKNSVEVAYI